MTRVFNFGAGPAILPEAVLAQVQRELLDYKGTRMSILEQSHRSTAYAAVQQEAEANVRELLHVPDNYAVLFLTGGATAQFAMVPMNLLGEGRTADYAHSGMWSGKAIQEAQVIGRVHLAADCAKALPTRVPLPAELKLTPGAAYVHITSNETVAGAQWKSFPQTEAPLVADMSSDIMSRPIDLRSFGLVYAGAQKNLGPAGVTLVMIRRDVAERASAHVPLMFRYATHIENHSLYNTPPCFAVYMLMLVTRWLKQQGGVTAIAQHNEAKAARLYAAIDASSFYRGTAAPDHRSLMNVTFRLPSEELEERFVAEAAQQGMTGLKGHRIVGGIRASIYNAFPPEGVDVLTAFMRDFEQRNG